jgi:hypothetical protein
LFKVRAGGWCLDVTGIGVHGHAEPVLLSDMGRITRSARDSSLPPGSYGLHGHGVQHPDKFEKAWYEKQRCEPCSRYGLGDGAWTSPALGYMGTRNPCSSPITTTALVVLGTLPYPLVAMVCTDMVFSIPISLRMRALFKVRAGGWCLDVTGIGVHGHAEPVLLSDMGGPWCFAWSRGTRTLKSFHTFPNEWLTR